jgi:hypothetical protein
MHGASGVKFDDGFEVDCVRVVAHGGALRAAVGEKFSVLRFSDEIH